MPSTTDAPSTPERDFLTIVSGLPRSGTSMMMSILQAGGIPVLVDGVREADEDNTRGYFEFEAVKKTKDDPSWLTGSSGKAVKMVYRLLQDLPNDHRYRVVFMRREMREIHASQETMLERNDMLDASMELQDFEKLFGRELQRILDWSQSQANLEILEVSYSEMVANPLPQLEAIATFLGGGLDIDAMRGVVEPTLYRQRA